MHTSGRFHSLGHFLAFCFIAYVAARISRSLAGRLLFFAGSLVFGFGIEVAEHLVFRIALEWKDVLVDAAGVIAGTLLAMASTPQEMDSTQ
jgi:cyanate permease